MKLQARVKKKFSFVNFYECVLKMQQSFPRLRYGHRHVLLSPSIHEWDWEQILEHSSIHEYLLDKLERFRNSKHDCDLIFIWAIRWLDPMKNLSSSELTILTREKLCFTQFSTRIAASLLLTFFKCFHNQLSSTHSIVIYFKKGDSSNRQ